MLVILSQLQTLIFLRPLAKSLAARAK